MKRKRIKGYQIFCGVFEEGRWTPIFEGEKLPLHEYVKNFKPITAQQIRFNVLETATPQEIWIRSLELFDAH